MKPSKEVLAQIRDQDIEWTKVYLAFMHGMPARYVVLPCGKIRALNTGL